MTETTSPPPSSGPEDSAEDRALVSGFLSKLALLSGALTGGGIFLLTDWTLGPVIRLAVAICLLSFGCALRGMDLRRSGPQWRWFRVSGSLLVLALAMALVGVILR
jgi:hypothetical protein